MHSVILGLGEVGGSYMGVLRDAGYAVYGKDIQDVDVPQDGCQVLHVALNRAAIGDEAWNRAVREAVAQYKPAIVDVLSTVPPGTTSRLGPSACHSTTRGLHPNLRKGILSVPKHIGGKAAGVLADYYSRAGVKCVVHRSPDTTETAHILHLLDYGIQIASADMRSLFCRKANVDYMESVVKYTDTHNSGFKAMDMPSKVRMNLFPSGGRIGGHCVVEAARLAREYGFDHPLVEFMAGYNG